MNVNRFLKYSVGIGLGIFVVAVISGCFAPENEQEPEVAEPEAVEEPPKPGLGITRETIQAPFEELGFAFEASPVRLLGTVRLASLDAVKTEWRSSISMDPRRRCYENNPDNCEPK